MKVEVFQDRGTRPRILLSRDPCRCEPPQTGRQARFPHNAAVPPDLSLPAGVRNPLPAAGDRTCGSGGVPTVTPLARLTAKWLRLDGYHSNPTNFPATNPPK